MSDILRIECDSYIDHATLYARGAVVTRRVRLPASLPDASVSICIGKITAFCEFQSFRAELAQDAPDEPGPLREIVAVRPRLIVATAPAPKSDLLTKAREALLSRVRLNMERAHLQKRRDLLAALVPDPKLSRKTYRTRHPEAKTLDALAAGSLIASELARLDARLWALAEELDKNKLLQESIDAEAAYCAEAEMSAIAQVEAAVELGPGGPIAGLSLSYAVVQARWAPTYTARFSEGGTRVSLSLSALVAQQSGEDWSQARLSLSTADRIADATLPKLQALRLSRELPPPERGYRAPPNGLESMFSGYDRFVAGVRGDALSESGLSLGAAGRASAGAVYHDETTRVGTSMDARSEMLGDELQGPKTTPGQPTLHSADRGLVEAHTPAPKALARGMAIPAEVSGTLPRTESLRSSAPGGGGGGADDFPQAEQTLAGAVSMPDLRSAGRPSPDELTLEADEEGGAGEIEPIAQWPGESFLNFDDLIMPEPTAGLPRGKLSREPVDDTRDWQLRQAQKEKEKATADLYNQSMPRGTADPWGHRKSGFFDVRYDTQGRTDVPCNGHFCQVFVRAWDAGSAMRFVTNPKEAEEVYREAEFQNPAQMPLLAGPVELFFDQAYVARTSMSHADRGGTILLGLGVEERLKIRRNTRVSESSAGFLGGSTAVDHTISIELSSALGRDTQITVFDRIPVTDDKEVEVKFVASAPAAESYSQTDRGSPVRKGLRFQVALPAGGKASIEFRYKVTLPSKSELVGGNRRES